jgi:hypothetical protein
MPKKMKKKIIIKKKTLFKKKFPPIQPVQVSSSQPPRKRGRPRK